MENTETTCTACRTPIRNQATDGRPDVWEHTTVTKPHCHLPLAPHEVEEGLPRETRRIRVRVQEIVTYDWETDFEVHVGVTPDELPSYIAAHEDRWIDDMDDNFHESHDRQVLDNHTFFIDDAGYLASLASGINTHPKFIMQWLTLTCPVCGVQPGADDTQHQNVGWFVGIACDGMRVVDPDWLGMEDVAWKNWAKSEPVNASRKAST
ncbi:hypothetical protein [Nonomuraea rhizosphaerae]|uniref:hypothetical protein n=1 Tax=Nonomuraea rhizosphaerae TaxID=2665663 RepID=UPI001C5F51F3|nr:hypothetical protein [Nonomuraea rhizosphaerae]